MRRYPRRPFSRPFRTLTVAALRDLLDGEDPDALVVFSADYGDYHHTEQALTLRGHVEEREVEESAYSHSGFALREHEDDFPGAKVSDAVSSSSGGEEEDGEDGEEEAVRVIVIR